MFLLVMDFGSDYTFLDLKSLTSALQLEFNLSLWINKI